MYLNEEDILDWIENYNTTGKPLSEEGIVEFIKELQNKIDQMDFSVVEDAVVIAYSGKTNGEDAWKVAVKTSGNAKDVVVCCNDLPAGRLIGKYRDYLTDVLELIVGDDENYINSIVGGCDANKKRLEGGSCGFGENLLSLDDYISAKLMGETVGASNNLIVFIPEGVDRTKVFATTELECIFKNDTFQYINGIPKGELEAIYRSGDLGKQSVYDIISKTSSEVVGTTGGIEV